MTNEQSIIVEELLRIEREEREREEADADAIQKAKLKSLKAHGLDDIPNLNKQSTVKLSKDGDKLQLSVTDGQLTRFMKLDRVQAEELNSELFLALLNWEVEG